MRTTADRIRHTLIFEGIALLIVTPLAVLFTDHSATSIGSLAIVLSLIAMCWNYGFNRVFDALELKMTGQRKRGWGIRITHAFLFELGLVIVCLPLIAWWLEISLWVALLMDLGFMLFFMLYALVYNWAYDMIFPVPVEVAPSN